ncbi:MAG: hypothetical protein OZ948_05285 [Deltaproteobacteria bacterium]|nr:hypothetical protein [Deltaproteobacteria bacterium]
MRALILRAHYNDHTEESRVTSEDDPCGMFVAGHFLEVRWPSPQEATVNVEGKDVRIAPAGTTEFTFIGVRVQATFAR